jgi:aryl-alcohol dehydrogenase-like predicted oxidoreductase
MKIALGTVQFGLEYGIANQSGRVRFEDARHILEQAAAHGINTLDTAIAYGESERTLGRLGVANWNLVTKLPELPHDCADVDKWVSTQIEYSVTRLGVSQLHGVLLHRPVQLLGAFGKQLSDSMLRLKAQGTTRKIGVSIYSPEELARIIDVMPLDLVQAPLNILDQRLVESGWANRLTDLGIELHARSAFLQGLLLMSPEQRPLKFSGFNSIWTEWSRWLEYTGFTPIQACLGYVLNISAVNKVVVGLDSAAHLKEIIATSQMQLKLPSLPNWKPPIATDLISPDRWSQL